MAELNNRKRKLSTENELEHECQEDSTKKQNINGSGPVEGETYSDSASTTITKNDDTPLISKSAIKSFSRYLPRNVVGTIGRKTSLLAKRTLRSGTRRGSLQTLNQGWDTISTLSYLGDDSNPQGDVTQKRKQNLSKYYTLRKLKEKFKTKRQLRKDHFRSLKMQTKDRYHKDLNRSKVESNKQGTLLEKLLEEHNKHLDSL